MVNFNLTPRLLFCSCMPLLFFIYFSLWLLFFFSSRQRSEKTINFKQYIYFLFTIKYNTYQVRMCIYINIGKTMTTSTIRILNERMKRKKKNSVLVFCLSFAKCTTKSRRDEHYTNEACAQPYIRQIAGENFLST